MCGGEVGDGNCRRYRRLDHCDYGNCPSQIDGVEQNGGRLGGDVNSARLRNKNNLRCIGR